MLSLLSSYYVPTHGSSTYPSVDSINHFNPYNPKGSNLSPSHHDRYSWLNWVPFSTPTPSSSVFLLDPLSYAISHSCVHLDRVSNKLRSCALYLPILTINLHYRGIIFSKLSLNPLRPIGFYKYLPCLQITRIILPT